MKLYNPYTRGSIDYPLDLSSENIVLEYHITHETFFCNWHTSWIVVHLESGDILYIPYGERNRRDIYVVTSYYLNHTVKHPHGVYTLNYNEFFKNSSLDIPNNDNEYDYDEEDFNDEDIELVDDDDDDDDDFDFEEFFSNNFKPKYINFY